MGDLTLGDQLADPGGRDALTVDRTAGTAETAKPSSRPRRASRPCRPRPCGRSGSPAPPRRGRPCRRSAGRGPRLLGGEPASERSKRTISISSGPSSPTSAARRLIPASRGGACRGRSTSTGIGSKVGPWTRRPLAARSRGRLDERAVAEVDAVERPERDHPLLRRRELGDALDDPHVAGLQARSGALAARARLGDAQEAARRPGSGSGPSSPASASARPCETSALRARSARGRAGGRARRPGAASPAAEVVGDRVGRAGVVDLKRADRRPPERLQYAPQPSVSPRSRASERM